MTLFVTDAASTRRAHATRPVRMPRVILALARA